jgi:hypothetical protein
MNSEKITLRITYYIIGKYKEKLRAVSSGHYSNPLKSTAAGPSGGTV